MVLGRRPTQAALCLAAAFALAALAAAQPDVPYLPEKETRCYECHAPWTPPLVQMYNILPPDEAGGRIGEEFNLNIQVQNAWLSDLVYFEPYVDLENAPSLGFVGGTPPLLDVIHEGVLVQAGPGGGGAALPETELEVEVSPGTTDLHLVLRPENRDAILGPDLDLAVIPPNMDPVAIRVDQGGPGEEERFHVAGVENLTELGYGVWRIIVDTLPGQGGVATEIPFTIEQDTYFNASASTRQYNVRTETIKPEKSTLFQWRLLPLAEPGPDESVTVMVNLTAYYKHTSNSPDWGNYTKVVQLPVHAVDGGLSIGAAPSTETVAPAGPVGVSMARVSEAVGYSSSFLLALSVWTGGMFGRASRRHLNVVFGSAKRRVGFHNFLSYGLTVAAIVHTVLFIVETNYEWTLGLIWGGIAILAMFALGVTGALQVPMIRKWNYATWRWSHFALAIASILFTVVHILLDGANFGDVQEAIGWQDPLSGVEWGQ